MEAIKILFIGDIVGRPGRRAVAQFLVENRKKYDFVIANGENLAGGLGFTYETYKEMKDLGVDYFTSGNHVWRNRDIIPYLKEGTVQILRPENYPDNPPGVGHTVIQVKGHKILILNLLGRVFIPVLSGDPFEIGKNILEEHKDCISIVDFHAEATSEKIAFAHYVDGLAAAVLGTHTHVQTADERILPKGTAFISDVGMCGPIDSVIGVEKDLIIKQFLTALPQSHKVASGESIFSALDLQIDTDNRKVDKISRIYVTYKSE